MAHLCRHAPKYLRNKSTHRTVVLLNWQEPRFDSEIHPVGQRRLSAHRIKIIQRGNAVSIGTIILIILIIILLGGFSGFGGGPFYGTGYYGGGGLGVVIVILLILILMGRI